MDLSDTLKGGYVRPKAPCGVARWIEGLDPGLQSSVVSAMGDKSLWPKHTPLFKLLKSEAKLKLGYNVFIRHRNEACGCYEQ